jgi:succinate dehydrogenase / fumarate reductase cytochrome b subunit
MYKSTGFISFVLRRFTGLVLVLYLTAHIYVIGGATQGVETFDTRMELLEAPILKLLEVLLIAAVLYHGFDGIRLIIVHYFDVTDYRKSMFYAAFAIAALLTVVGGIPLVLFAFGLWS